MIAGSENTFTGGKLPSYRSASTRQLFAEGPCANEEVPMSLVTAFGLPWISRLFGFAGYVVPCPGRDLHDSAPQRIRQPHARKELPPVVEHADNIAIADASLLGIERIHPHWLAAMDLRLLTRTCLKIA